MTEIILETSSLPEHLASLIQTKRVKLQEVDGGFFVMPIEPTKLRKSDLLSPVELDLAGWKWSREEANER